MPYNPVSGQILKGLELLEKSINYHDPETRWEKFKGVLRIDQLDPENNFLGKRNVYIDLQKDFFRMEQKRGHENISRQVEKNKCTNSYNGMTNIPDSIIQKHRMDCSRAKMYRDYFTYLYGLPMKLKDPGTIIDPEVKKSMFNGTDSYALKVTYDAAVGTDTWYFYFDPNSFVLIGYKFYHDETKGDGEYILLKGEVEINGIKIPKERYWYTNKEKKFLGADLLKN